MLFYDISYILKFSEICTQVPFWDADYAVREELDGHPMVRAVHEKWVESMGGGDACEEIASRLIDVAEKRPNIQVLGSTLDVQVVRYFIHLLSARSRLYRRFR